ncbi:alternative ribosome rescue aminoacyl-tRNA hydrolase ArfB [Allorhodopirellula heiligendammensis]|uniref:Peptidyl-tRNA hydrolase ArfB n=1 Tax=Allorhodopirellula heiligendammensis TaxID=2714739 RepID=A0A5C6BUP6_9BACT|nr:alternative ribosome rescue aminoacyl-tRNA hydrolase ArfB [Allorhodopirellula heiligendammensis]TWU15768.1 Peptidyl-tRNA hydrolase ArfB [Allorhodopirellula heiligendammensis]|tara:strand:- start:283 stop:711 length:429 start_codon:yes stop_codon:yes gene_type:complete
MSDLSVTKRFKIPDSDLRWSASRSSGPGGQNVNKVNSKVTLRWTPVAQPGFDDSWRHRFMSRFSTRINREGELVLHSEKTRDQNRNLADARARLVGMLLECRLPPKTRTPTRPTLGSKKRRIEGKRRLSDKKRLRGRPQRDD